MSPVPKEVMAVTLDCPAESPNVDDSKVRRSEAAGDAASDGCGSSLALGAVVGGASDVPVGAGMVADACGPAVEPADGVDMSGEPAGLSVAQPATMLAKRPAARNLFMCRQDRSETAERVQ